MTKVVVSPAQILIRNQVDDPSEASELRATALGVARALAAGGRVWGWSATTVQWGEPLQPLVLSSEPLQALAQARAAIAPGDMLLIVASGSDPLAANLALRSQAWGARTAWLGEQVQAGSSHQVLRGQQPQTLIDAVSARYQQLIADAESLALAVSQPPADAVCITCSDEGRLAEVQALDDGLFVQAVVRTEQSTSESVDLMLTPGVQPFDLVLIHAGMAITQVAAPSLSTTKESA